MKHLLLLVFVANSLIAYSQQVVEKTIVSTGLDSNFNRITIDSAFYIKKSYTLFSIKSEIITKDNRLIKKTKNDTVLDVITVTNYYPSGKKKDSTILTNKKHDFSSYGWFENGVLRYKKQQYLGKLKGELITNWSDGTNKRRDLYKDGNLIKGNCYTKTGEDTTHFEYFIQPSYKGGEAELFKDLFTKLKYPIKAKESKVQGKVYINFVIEKDGSISNVKVKKGIGYGCDKEALKLVNDLGKWNPGTQDGEPIRVSFTMPVNFRLR